MSLMRFNFNIWRSMIHAIDAEPIPAEVPKNSGFPIHPSASELAEAMLIDTDILKNETYEPGLYDEDGDYYPQYTDDPSKMPEYFAPNDLGDAVPEPVPAETLAPSDDVKSDSE